MKKKIKAAFTMPKLILRALSPGNFWMLRVQASLAFDFLTNGALRKRNYRFGHPNVRRKMTVQEAEDQIVSDGRPLFERKGLIGVPYSQISPKWAEFIALMREGDELWWYNSSSLDWECLCGGTGFILVRNGKVIKEYGYMMN